VLSDPNYFECAVAALRAAAALAELGIKSEEIAWHPQGRQFRALMQIAPSRWNLPMRDGAAAGYEGVAVHYESNHPGDLKLHCELYPRLGSETKADQAVIRPLLLQKGGVASMIREQSISRGWDATLGAHLRRTTPILTDPRSLMVLGFDLNLEHEHAPEGFASAVERVVLGTVAAIDEVLLTESRVVSP
jgi:hypothetical protein